MTSRRNTGLLYVSPGPLTIHEGVPYLPARTVAALTDYSAHWDGPVVITGHGVDDGPPASEDVDVRAVEAFEIAPSSSAAVLARSLDPAVVLALHKSSSSELLDGAAPVVLISEHSRTIRTGLTISGMPDGGRLEKARVRVGSWRGESGFRRLARRAAGLQANGPASWKAYGRNHSNAIMFHDHRITDADVARAARVDRADASTFRVAFSGRLIRAKGAHVISDIARRLHRDAPDIEIDLLGSGALEAEIRDADLPNLTVLGFKDFRTEWIPYVQEHVDLMLLPHLQGDPSCTYFESWGSGAPVIGFRNETLTPVVERHRCGWSLPTMDVDAISAKIIELSSRPEEYRAARHRGLDLVSTHSYEVETRRRLDMLAATARA